ncbi:NinG-like phage protein [Yersinia rohdei]|uniref:NinG-like phage protein n=1 Tax=Yersinia rohdei TaxID=29485 RepID=A0A0U1HQT1_YERRO|nr:recombination protein NinG [Yersinia rohdei]CNJ54338.1 NinG-like phage protein [Yersinia rohdei]CQI88925.1 NinG-like phage protein [Yersinia rohdei]
MTTGKPKNKPVKLKKCKVCPTKFAPFSSTQKACSVPCARIIAKQDADKKQQAIDRKAWQKRKESLKTASDWNKEAQVAVNRYVFWRDYSKPCIACGNALNYGVRGGAVDASHYRSRGTASHLRFNVFNIHAGCVRCNREMSGNLIPFRRNLIIKIGIDRVDRLETDNNPRKFDIPYLQRVKAIFTRRAKHYEKLRKRYLEAA